MMASTNNFLWTNINSDDEFFKRESFACAVYKNRYIVVAGGKRKQGFLQSAAMYDVSTGIRTPLPNLPDCGECFGRILKEYFYVSSWNSRNLYRISLSTPSRWQLVISKIDQHILGMVTEGSHLYFLGYGKLGNKLYRYEPQPHRLTCVSKVPFYTRHNVFATAIVEKYIYVIGSNVSVTFPINRISECKLRGKIDVQVFDIKTKSWSQGSYLPPKPPSNMISCVTTKWIIVSRYDYPIRRERKAQIPQRYDTCNDKIDFHTRTVTYMYNRLQEKWTQNDLGLHPYRANHCFVTVGSIIISIGGRKMNNCHCFIEAIHTTKLIDHCNWEAIKVMVLIYALVEKHRAYPIIVKEKKNHNVLSRVKQIYKYILNKKEKNKIEYASDPKIDQVEIMQKLLTEFPVDIFREVLSYLL